VPWGNDIPGPGDHGSFTLAGSDPLQYTKAASDLCNERQDCKGFQLDASNGRAWLKSSIPADQQQWQGPNDPHPCSGIYIKGEEEGEKCSFYAATKSNA
jgi:hypothetical protein